MNDEYLWDKSGEPDPEIQQLEQVLGTLRYQPKPLVFADTPRPAKQNHHSWLIAIAATFVVAILAAGIWLTMTKESEPPLNVMVTIPAASPISEPPASPATDQTESSPAPKIHSEVVAKRSIKRATHVISPSLTKEEREEASEVKQQLMVALKVASEKLSLAQRKTQGPSPNQIRNQHKVG